MCIYDIRTTIYNELAFVQIDPFEDTSLELSNLMDSNEAVKANIQLPYVGSYGQYENCLVFPNPADPLFCP